MSVDVRHEIVTSLIVNPGNWRQIALATESTVTIFTVEQSDTRYSSQNQSVIDILLFVSFIVLVEHLTTLFNVPIKSEDHAEVL